ncbi:hypothetical protein H0H92_004085, partial [Tricholoma furcatifolium]
MVRSRLACNPVNPSATKLFEPVLLTLEEKGYGIDEIDRKQVDLGKILSRVACPGSSLYAHIAANGANFDPTFLRLNPKGTVPTLVVPMEKTLANDVESRYKALTETELIIDFLDKSRSATSRTRTTSSAPAPTLHPATIAFSTRSKAIIDVLHSKEGDPNYLTSHNARNEASLRTLAADKLAVLSRKHKVLEQYISDAEQDKLQISLKMKPLWQAKKTGVDTLLAVMEDGQKLNGELSVDALREREQFYAEARQAWEIGLTKVLVTVNNDIIGPFLLGDQLSLADLHLASWLARVVRLSGGLFEDNGATAIAKLEAHIGGGFILEKNCEVEGVKQNKLVGFWDAMRGRESWKAV